MNNTQQKSEWLGLERELQLLEQAVADAVVIPNSWLPKELHDNTRGGRTIARLSRVYDKRDGITDHKKKKAIKAKNIEIYREQVDNAGEIDYNGGQVDDIQLHRNQCAIVQAWIDTRVMTSEDLGGFRR
jgi:hypothetical protein